MDRQKQAELVASCLGRSEKILILTHKNPDGDAIGSSLALSYGLTALGKSVESVNIDGVPEALMWLEGAEMILQRPTGEIDFDTYILLDCNEYVRTGFDPALVEGIPFRIIIDHHPGVAPDPVRDLIDPASASSGQLVYEVLKALGADIPPSVAMDIYLAIHTDTGGFRFPNTDADAFKTAAAVTELGAIPSHVAVMLMERENASRMKLLGLALGTLEVASGGRVAYACITKEMFDRTGTKEEHTDGFVNYPRSIDGVEVAMLFKEKDADVWRVTIRSRGLLDVSSIARELGGGGHRNASGATIPGKLKDVTAAMVARVTRGLDELSVL